MSDSILIKGGKLIDPSQNIEDSKDLLIENGQISAIDKPGAIPNSKAQKVIELKHQYIFPGFVDVHVHLREPGLEYKETIETGTKASVAGGFTSVACMANTQPVNDSAHVTAIIREKARAHGHCHVYPVGAITIGLKGEQLAEIGGMHAEGAVAISDDGMPVMNSYLMRKAMDYAKAFNIPVITHSEDLNLVGKGVMNEGILSTKLGLRGNPAAAEEIMVAREISLCRLTKCPTHIAHVSTKLAVAHIRRAKEEGLPITAEVTPHHLMLTEESLTTYDTCCKMAPPLRTPEDTEALVEALADGTIDMIATDHAPHATIDKATEFDRASFGLIGLQTAVPLTYSLVKEKRITLKRWTETLTLRPATLIQIPAGTLKKGSIADLTLFDPDAKWTYTQKSNASRSANTPWLNQELQGKILKTFVKGAIKYDSA